MNMFSRLLLAMICWNAVVSRAAFAQAQTTEAAKATTPDAAARSIRVTEGLELQLFAAEPLVRQPVSMSFDHRGRLWVLEYLQYPNPNGLQPTAIDEYLRTKYDRLPEPPPHGPKGTDRIAVLEDLDGDGRADRAQEFLSGLNLASGMALGYDGVFVTQPPYLLFYADRDHDDVPDGDPEVLLTGFGMEDAHAFANSLTWGPDGWLYGAQGSTVTADIRGIGFQQGIWRYHVPTKRFELFAEGGGNTWGIDFDRNGQLFAGGNTTEPLCHHVQGAYYIKGFGKHGPLHNPFAFGYFNPVKHVGFLGTALTGGCVIYQGGLFPERFNDACIYPNLRANAMRVARLKPVGSTFETHYQEDFAVSSDVWFRPVDCLVGPDGALYAADWCDVNISHTNPQDRSQWYPPSREDGRIWRFVPAGTNPRPMETLALERRESNELVKLLGHRNAWYAREARRILGERRDGSVVELLRPLIFGADEHLALEALWATYVSGGFDGALAVELLSHRSPAVRAWTVRLIGDDIWWLGQSLATLDETRDKSMRPSDAPAGSAPGHRRGPTRPSRGQAPAAATLPQPPRSTAFSSSLSRLLALAQDESDPTVRSQLACTAKRLPAEQALPIVERMLRHDDEAIDAHIPLLLWWAVEDKAVSDRAGVLGLFTEKSIWQHPMVHDVIAERLVRRYAGERSDAGWDACVALLNAAPNVAQRNRLVAAIDLQLSGGRLDTPPQQLAELIQHYLAEATAAPAVLRLALRLHVAETLPKSLDVLSDRSASADERAALVAAVGATRHPECVARLLACLSTDEPLKVRTAALSALQAYDDASIAETLVAGYADMTPELKDQARGLLVSRAAWAQTLIDAVRSGKIAAGEVDIAQVRQMLVHAQPQLNRQIESLWGKVTPSTTREKQGKINAVQTMLAKGKGDAAAGKPLMLKHCGVCHQLFGEGNKIGPDLTTADRKNLAVLLPNVADPSAVIRPEFVAYSAQTVDGRVLLGLIADSSPDSVTLLDANNVRTTLARHDIEVLEAVSTSLMPERLLDALTTQEIRDLFAYLRSDRAQ